MRETVEAWPREVSISFLPYETGTASPREPTRPRTTRSISVPTHGPRDPIHAWPTGPHPWHPIHETHAWPNKCVLCWPSALLDARFILGRSPFGRREVHLCKRSEPLDVACGACSDTGTMRVGGSLRADDVAPWILSSPCRAAYEDFCTHAPWGFCARQHGSNTYLVSVSHAKPPRARCHATSVCRALCLSRLLTRDMSRCARRAGLGRARVVGSARHADRGAWRRPSHSTRSRHEPQ
jgi:hypothetical protein